MFNRLQTFLDKNYNFHKYQFGFRKNHTTGHALMDVTDFIYKAHNDPPAVEKIIVGVMAN